MPAQSVHSGTALFCYPPVNLWFTSTVHTQKQMLLAMQILFRTHLQILEGWENYLIIGFNNCICFTTSLLNDSVSGQILAEFITRKKLRDSRTGKGREVTNLVHAELPTKLQDSQTQAPLHLIIVRSKNQRLVPLHTVALHKESKITAEDCNFMLKDSLQV